MKRRCVPLRADHDLLTPDTDTLSGVRLHPVHQVRLEGVTSLSGHLSDSSSSESAVRVSKRCPVASPTRRLRFEDETETEAESRYLERQQQRRRGVQRGTEVLVSKPDLNHYINGRAGPRYGPQGAGHVVDRWQRGRKPLDRAGQCNTCHSGLNLCLCPPVPQERGRTLYRPCLNLHTEPIRETYIGSVTPMGGGDGAGCDTNDQVRRRTNEVELNGNQMTIPQVTPTTDLPINPYAPDQMTAPSFKCQPSPSPPPVTSAMMSQSIKLNGTTSEQETPAAPPPNTELRPGPELKGRKSSSSETTAESQAPPTSDSAGYGQDRQPMRAELHRDDMSLPEHVLCRDQPSRLSLRRLLSNVSLSRTRTASLDRLNSRPRPSVSDPAPWGPRMSSSLLKKTPSVQSLSVGSPFLQFRKSSSVQNFVSEQKKKMDRSADYRPSAEQFLQRCLTIEDIGRPSSVRSVGRVLQVYSDGTFLLEISRPKSQTFGFIISRGRGRPDSGVYVDDMVDSSTEKLYAGLLAVGDEILEVNGEKVACLNLDQVTHLLTQNTSTTVRMLRHWRTPPQ
ncbi:uncharacterized protein si:dkey-121a11.3 [Epinephelus moara]|uniref:uncharacterized protein si:dkey-121a11.3 n=1 Tax=Epinephelus moara TaxID=300413 RepID=UPI00214E28D0|nr:uncharacterized protein si:dkey-121a11.3 [Epinephelus moara]